MNRYERDRQINYHYDQGYAEGYQNADSNNIDQDTLDAMIESAGREAYGEGYNTGIEAGRGLDY